jgi:acetyl-CoA carboxylase biotin carboxyl carrier protein
MSLETHHAAEPDPMPGDSKLLRELTSMARELAAGVPGPLRRVTLRLGAAWVELEWEDGTREGADLVYTTSTVAPAPPPSPVEEAPETLVRSPIVGTFYHASAPGDPPFVVIGSIVEPDTVIGIVEAMKLMNRVSAGHAGVVRSVLVPDATSVEFDQPLIALDPPPEQDGGQR